MLMPEVLAGDNQFYCDICQRKSDASRRQLLRNVPPILCLALQRFYFNYQVRCLMLQLICVPTPTSK